VVSAALADILALAYQVLADILDYQASAALAAILACQALVALVDIQALVYQALVVIQAFQALADLAAIQDEVASAALADIQVIQDIQVEVGTVDIRD
jgi:hypothetical protein